MANRRHFAHRIDRQVIRLALLTFFQIEQMQLIVGAQLFEQGAGARGTALRRVEKADVGSGHHLLRG